MKGVKAFRKAIDHSPFLKEGLFCFFPVSACYAVLMPLIWVGIYQLSYPDIELIPPQQLHSHEMIFGFYTAALAGFLCSAVAEWTNTKPRRGKQLILLLLLWLPARFIGFWGADSFILIGGFFDLCFLALLLFFVASPIIQTRRWRSLSFALWLAVLLILDIALYYSWWTENIELSSRILWAFICVYIILFSLSITRINTVVANLALDPTGETSPYRPHPGRRNLAAFLTALYALSMLVLPQSQMQYYLAFAASAGFMDRAAEWFIGKAAFKTEVLCLMLANISASLGFLLIGLSGFNSEISPYLGLHILTIGSLGLAVLGVFTIAGLRHSGRTLITIQWQSKMAVLLIVLSAMLRIAPELLNNFSLNGYHYLISSLLWSLAFILWLWGYIPLIKHQLKQ